MAASKCLAGDVNVPLSASRSDAVCYCGHRRVCQERENVLKLQRRYGMGVKSIFTAEELTLSMQQELQSLQPVLDRNKLETMKMMEGIEAEQAKADETRRLMEAEQQVCMEKAMEAQRMKMDCESDLAGAMPELESTYPLATTRLRLCLVPTWGISRVFLRELLLSMTCSFIVLACKSCLRAVGRGCVCHPMFFELSRVAVGSLCRCDRGAEDADSRGHCRRPSHVEAACRREAGG